MIALLQRVEKASVTVKDQPDSTSAIGPGLMILLGVSQADTYKDAENLAEKIAKARLFSDDQGKMNLDIHAVKGEILLISQFTLIADTKNGNRPSFIKAATPETAEKLYLHLKDKMTDLNIPVKTGFFGQYMLIKSTLDGPVTIHLDSTNL